ncbi:MAG: hypothetical protein AAGD38_15105 [Acidobacteriota bacterium]
MKKQDDRVGELLRSLPAVEASPGFTRRVLARLDQPATASRPTHGGMWRWATAALLVLLVAMGGWQLHGIHEQQQRQAELDELRQEYLALRAEVDELQRLRDELPVFYLGGTDDVDLVLDVANLVEMRKARDLAEPHAVTTGTHDL